MRVVVLALATVAAAVAAATGLAAPNSHAASRYASGVERWTVKTLQDRPHLLRNKLTTVKYLVTRRPPYRHLLPKARVERAVRPRPRVD